MKVLFVSSAPLEYSASSNMRNIALLKGFIQNGYKVYTLTPEPQKDSPLYDENLCNIEIEKKYYISMSSLKFATTIKNKKKSKLKSMLYNLIKKFKIYDFRSSLAKKDVEIKEKFDIMISSSDPKSSHLIAENLRNRNPNIAKKWIQYWGDPFATDINNKSFVPNYLIRKEEKRLLSLGDIILYVSPFTLEKQKQLYSKFADKMIFLPIPYNEKIYYEKTGNERLKLGYFGEYHSRNRNILPLYKALKNVTNMELTICGNSDLSLEKKENIDIFDRQSIQVIRQKEEKMDILICICNKGGTQIPGKIYHYSATNKAIMILLDGEKSDELEEYFNSFNRFIICKNNEKEIASKLKEIQKSSLEYSPLEELLPENIVKKLLIESEKYNEKNTYKSIYNII